MKFKMFKGTELLKLNSELIVTELSTLELKLPADEIINETVLIFYK